MATRSIALPRLTPTTSPRAFASLIWARCCAMLRARQTRQILGEMDDRMLADIGIGRGDATAEAARPMWDLQPRHR